MQPLVIAQNLTKTYKTTQVLYGLNLKVTSGESLAILGQSGSGKTTLLSLLAGLEQPDSGTIQFQGQLLSSLSVDKLAQLRGKSMGIIFQEYHLIPSLTAHENVALPLEIQKIKAVDAQAKALLERVGLSQRAKHYPHQLSGGEQQRVAIARALVSKPTILFADEPTGNLDEETAESIEALIFSLIKEDGLTGIIVTHNRELAKRCSRILTLHLGRFN